MQLVILDGYTINPGDLSWDGLKVFGEYVAHDRTKPNEVLERAQQATVVLTSKVVLDKRLIDLLPALRYIGVMATGYNVVDLAAASAHGIVVTNVPAYSTPATAQGTFALLLELTNHVGHYSALVRNGQWTASPDFNYLDNDRPVIELAGLTFGIIGFGHIGQAVARIAHALGMNVLVHTRTRRVPPDGLPITFCSRDEIFSKSDVLSLHCPLTEETRAIVNSACLSLMKPSALLLNTGRGPLVNEHDLAEALNAQRIAGTGLDVLSVEPPPSENPLLHARNCVITPHNGWATRATRQRLIDVIISNISAFAAGRPVNVVNPQPSAPAPA